MSVAPTRGPVQRPGEDRDFTEIFQRLDDLERAAAFIRFLLDNEGGWLYIQTNDPFDLDDLPDPLAVGGTWGFVLEDGSGAGMLIGSTAVLRLQGGTMALESIASPLAITVNGQAFEFRDDGSIHGPTGGNVVFDL